MSYRKYREMVRRWQESPEYWKAETVNEFQESLAARMKERKMIRADLARRLGTSAANVSKLLNSSNWTLETMVRLAMAVEASLHVHLAERNAAKVQREARGRCSKSRGTVL